MEKAKFKVNHGGPLEVSGNFVITDRDGIVIDTEETIYLCRCGGSSNKPFCDGTHNKNGFNK